MAKDTTPKQQPKENAPKPLVLKIIQLPIVCFFFLFKAFIIATILAIVIELLGMTFIWDDSPTHAREMFDKEYAYLAKYYTGSIGNWTPIQFTNSIINIVADFFAENSLVAELSFWWNSPPTSNFGSFIKTYIPKLGYYGQAIIYITLTIAMRMTIFILSGGWFLLCGILGLVNGLIDREIRREEGGLEHSYLFHFATSHIGFSLQIAWIAYLSFPFAIYPSLIIVPAGIAFGSTISLAASTFKKYL